MKPTLVFFEPETHRFWAAKQEQAIRDRTSKEPNAGQREAWNALDESISRVPLKEGGSVNESTEECKDPVRILFDSHEPGGRPKRHLKFTVKTG